MISLSAYAANDVALPWRGSVPGASESERWAWVKNHIELLATSDKAGVDKILSPDAKSQHRSTSSYDLRIADVPNISDAFNKVVVGKKDYYSLSISFDETGKVINAAVKLNRLPIPAQMMQKAH
ncbi:MAG: hypothetical protein P4L53_06705 [Candidatus Obscuribacterales bacterium]|nr:hypothetical protein [Candidatus Obscuribacterales bacterium]